MEPENPEPVEEPAQIEEGKEDPSPPKSSPQMEFDENLRNPDEEIKEFDVAEVGEGAEEAEREPLAKPKPNL